MLTIRRFRRRGFSPDELVANGTLTAPLAELLARAVRRRCNLLVCGGTGSGKTTLLNALSSFIGPGERVVTIEDAAELRLRQPHVLRLESRPPNLEGRGEVTIRRLVRNALRMRPDRIVVGEVRGAEALDMLTAISTGHDGSLCTVHAGSAAEALRRLETLALMADVGLPHAAIREQVADAIDLVVHQARAADGSRRVPPSPRSCASPAGRPRARSTRCATAGRPGARRSATSWRGRGWRAADERRAGRRASLSAALPPRGGAACSARGSPRDRGGRRGSPAARARARAARPALARGRAPSAAERRRLAAARGGSLLAGGWLLGGPLLGARGRARGPAAVLAVVRARRGRYREELGRGAAGAARALADALAARATRSAAPWPGRAGAPGRGGPRAADRGARARPRRADRRRARAPPRSARRRAWDTLVAAILLQRDAGGDLPALLRDLAAALEAADRLERDARAATAQARFTAWLVVGLPLAAAALAELAAPGFLRALVAAPLPAALAARALLLQAGLVAIHRIVRVRRA